MSHNPPEVDEANYYSPQAIRTEMFRLDLQIENIKAFVRHQADQMNQVMAQLMDLQHQIRSCMARHDENEHG